MTQLVITQNADIRFLGKLLGDVIRRDGGDALFQRIEAIRAASVDRHRGIANPRGLAAGWETLSLDETVAFVRSFMLFSMLANLAEDRQGAAVEEGSTLASVLQFLGSQGVDNSQVAALLERARITPVITAHPTEVMRKSMLDHRNRIAALMRLRDAGGTETSEGELIEEAIGAQIALLWQTRALRRERLYVSDEVDTAAHLSSRYFSAHVAGAVHAVGAPVGQKTREFPAAGQLDRRRPRRQSACHRRLAAPRAQPAPRMRSWRATWSSSTRWARSSRCRAVWRGCPMR